MRRALRAPALLDRRGLRWLLQTTSPALVVVLVHRGRRSGRMYRTPVEAIVEDRQAGEIVVCPMWGQRSDWYRNVRAGGLVELHVRGETWRPDWRELSIEEKCAAIAAYRSAHAVYSQVVLRVLMRMHEVGDGSDEAIARALPMLGLRAPAAGAG